MFFIFLFARQARAGLSLARGPGHPGLGPCPGSIYGTRAGQPFGWADRTGHRAQPGLWPAVPGPGLARHSQIDTPSNITSLVNSPFVLGNRGLKLFS